jgi:hypothetical protein
VIIIIIIIIIFFLHKNYRYNLHLHPISRALVGGWHVGGHLHPTPPAPSTTDFLKFKVVRRAELVIRYSALSVGVKKRYVEGSVGRELLLSGNTSAFQVDQTAGGNGGWWLWWGTRARYEIY